MPTSRGSEPEPEPEQLTLEELAELLDRLRADHEARLRAGLDRFCADVGIVIAIRPTETVWPDARYL